MNVLYNRLLGSVLFCAIVLMTINAPVMARNSVKIYEDDTLLYEVDTDSIQRQGHLVEFWAYEDWGIDAIEQYEVVNCQTQQAKVLKRYDEGGQMEYPGANDRWGNWWNMQATAEGRALFNYFCNP